MEDQSSSSPHLHRAAGRLAGRAIRRNRVVNASLTAGTRLFSSIGRVLQTLFLETMGLFFLLFAFTGGFASYREYRAYSDGDIGIERVVLGVIFTVLFGYFALTSFWRAQRRQQAKETN